MDNQNQQVPPVNNSGAEPTNNVPPINPEKHNSSRGLMETLEYYLVTKAPFQIPNDVKETIVKFMPWVNVIFLITLVPLILVLVGLGSITASVYSGVRVYSNIWSISSIISFASFVLAIMAIPGLLRRKIRGWKLSFYEIIIQVIGSILSANIIGAIIGAIIGLYILFQVKSYYK